MALFGAFLIEEGINPQVADAKRQQHLFLGIDGIHVEANQTFSFASSDLAIEAGVFHCIASTVQGCNIAGHERLAAANLYFTHTVEIANTGGVQVEVIGHFLRLVGVGHGGSPVSRKNEDARSLTEK
ncbi:hypothetical protein ALQ97_200174 [Pseudomonas savastanoi pv. glycinea]|nr:hypothetical protein ALQ97_200174 [Pseudomonas savastanoi pv. glycinea]